MLHINLLCRHQILNILGIVPKICDRYYVVKQLDSVEFYEMNWLNVSLNECILFAGMAFIPDKAEPNIGREVTLRPTQGCTV
jgi:hypothetical protein